MSKDLWKKKNLLKPSKPIDRGRLVLHLENGTWNLKIIQNGENLIEIYEEDDFHFPGPLVTEADIPAAIQSFIAISDHLLNRV
ncbi:MAG: hypothetical protein ACKOW2_04620 [Sphingobacteriaceae bacterium]